MTTQVTAENFHETFNLDFAVALVDGLTNLDSDSVSVTKLQNWCSDRGYEVDRDVCLDVLVSQIESRIQLSDAVDASTARGFTSARG